MIMSAIKVLDKILQDKIAAGEVVERPSSVVKELVENAIDADATDITVYIEESGMKSIRIIDNGHGIRKEDAPLVFERHATSKISTDYDLFQVRQLGFRGEALASIGSVSHATIESFNDESKPFKLTYHGGEQKDLTDGKERVGTDILIENLFYNTPARLKYVRHLKTEAGKIIDVISRVAIAHPNVAFKLELDGSTRVQTKGNGNLKEVIADIYGLNIAKAAIPFEHETQDFNITGFIVKPEISRSNKNYIHVSINQRHIKNFGISQAIINGYHSLLPKDKYPIAFLNIDMDPKLVDVNVHPTKLEVRISKDRALFVLIEEAVKATLRGTPLIPEITHDEPEQPFLTEQQVLNLAKTPDYSYQNFSKKSKPFVEEQVQSRRDVYPDYYETETKTDYGASDNVEVEEEQETQPEVKTDKLPYFEIIGQLHGTYVLLQNDQGLYLMDQHAAQERIKYEYYYQHVDENSESTPLLIPYTFEFPQMDVIAIDEKLDDLKTMGFEIERVSHSTYHVMSYPNWINSKNPEVDIQDLLDFILEKDSFSIQAYKEEVSIMLSCKRSIKANRYLTNSEIEQLLNDLNACESPYTCPHGRPVIIHYSTNDIERQFNRIMK